ncbi:transposase family protein [Thermobifida halotolerans]|uniref:transposase family protein n=1 Tax=Thermobifida halotolerans TaxID=483545 RepID=UPI001F1800B9|nr:transposase family protein [Thermobifida halotolerans]
MAAGFGVSTTTAWRYVRTTTRLLAAQAPTLEQGLRRVRRRGHALRGGRRHPHCR